MEFSFKVLYTPNLKSIFRYCNATADLLEIYSNVKYYIFKSSCIVSVEKDGFILWISNHRKNSGNEGNFVMTQLNTAFKPIKSHVAVRAESEQTRKHWSLLTTSDPGWFIPEEAQRGVWMVCMSVCESMWASVVFCVFLCNRNLCPWCFEKRPWGHFVSPMETSESWYLWNFAERRKLSAASPASSL